MIDDPDPDEITTVSHRIRRKSREKLKEYAKEMNVSRSEYIDILITNAKRRKPPKAKEKKTKVEMKELTKYLNSEGPIPKNYIPKETKK